MAKPKTKPMSYVAPAALVTPQSYDQCMTVVIGVDQVASAMETRWGIRRLPLIVSDDTRLRFRSACVLWSAAIRSWQISEITRVGSMMRRAWATLEAEAISLGHGPIDPRSLETVMPDGTVLAIVDSPDDAHHVARTAAGRQVIALTVDEVGRLYQKYGRADIQTAILATFPGAAVAAKREGEMSSSAAHDWVTNSVMAELLGDDLGRE